jgi:hypothetical protein
MSLNNIYSTNDRTLFCNTMNANQLNIANSFSSYLSPQQVLNTSGTTALIINNLLISNSHYNTSTGAFTIPYDSTYLVNASIGLDIIATNTDTVHLFFQLLDNGSIIRSSIYQTNMANNTDNNHINLKISEYAAFTSGHVIGLQVSVSSGTLTSLIANTGDTYFSMIAI